MNGKTGFVLGVALCAAGSLIFVVPAVIAVTSTIGTELKEGVTPVSSACGDSATVTKLISTGGTPKVSGFSTTQVTNAAAIVQAGSAEKMPPRAWVIATATAMQESQLKNLANRNPQYPAVKRISLAQPHDGVGRDHDSVGILQQRPNEGDGSWGPVKDLMNPQYAAKKFYAALRTVDGWQSMTLTRAAQRVQKSAYPNAYAKWEDEAGRLVDALSGGAAKSSAAAPTIGKCAADTTQVSMQVTSGGWVKPVNAPVGSPFGYAERGRLHAGVDLSTRRGVPIYAAAAGTVVKMECDKHEDGVDCNRDGSPSTPGCGWHLYIRHAGKIITHYCHMLRRPLVDVGDQVKAGQQIGLLGTSGHSSGPHLHFEVHVRGDQSNAGAIDPVKFMKQRGARLGYTKGAEQDA